AGSLGVRDDDEAPGEVERGRWLGIPRHAEDQVFERLDVRDGHRDPRLEADGVVGVDVLPVRLDVVRAVDTAAGQIRDRVVAVEPATALAELRDPRPHVLRPRLAADGAGGGHVGVRQQVVAGEFATDLVRGGSPGPHPGLRSHGSTLPQRPAGGQGHKSVAGRPNGPTCVTPAAGRAPRPPAVVGSWATGGRRAWASRYG